MPPGKLDPAVLVALGILSTGCGDKDTVTATPCLGVPYDTGDTGDTGETGPCLDYKSDTTEDSMMAADAPAQVVSTSRSEATSRVLERGTLPEDVVKLISARLSKD